MAFFSFTLPRQFHRLTLKFVLEVAFSVAVTLAATKVIGFVLASSDTPKASIRAEGQGLPAASPQLASQDSAQATASPDMTRFMEKAALSHVAVPWAADVVTPPVRAAILTSANAGSARDSKVSAVPLPPERPVSKSVTPVGTVSAPGGAGPTASVAAPALPALPTSNLVAVANPSVRPLSPVSSGPLASSALTRPLVDVPRPPADVTGRKPKPEKGLLARAGEVKTSLIESVSSVGSSIGTSIGSLFKRN